MLAKPCGAKSSEIVGARLAVTVMVKAGSEEVSAPSVTEMTMLE